MRDVQPLSVHLVTLLVPVVVMGGWLVLRHLGPAAVAAPSPPPAPLDLRVTIGHDGFHLLGVVDVLPYAPADDEGGVHVPCETTPCLTPADYDLATLGHLLAAVKHRRPDARAIALVPQPQTPYALIVRTMTAVQAVHEPADGPVAYPHVTISGPNAW